MTRQGGVLYRTSIKEEVGDLMLTFCAGSGLSLPFLHARVHVIIVVLITPRESLIFRLHPEVN